MPLEDIAARARAEGDRAEAENPDEEEAAEQEETPFQAPEGVPTEEPQPQPTTPGLTPEQTVELEKATTAYLKRVDKAFGGQSPPPCPHCNGLGFDLFGDQPAPELRQHERFQTCEACGGEGDVLTGSKVETARVLPCPSCKGNGYIDKEAQPTMPQIALAPPAYAPEHEAIAPAWMGNATVPTAR